MVGVADGKRKRPAGEDRALTDSLAGGVPDSTPDRCSVCGSRIYAVESLRTGIGRDCRRRLVALLAGKEAHSSQRREPRSSRQDHGVDADTMIATSAAELVVALRLAVDALEVLLGGGR